MVTGSIKGYNDFQLNINVEEGVYSAVPKNDEYGKAYENPGRCLNEE